MCDAGGSLICGATDVVNSGTMLRPSRGAGNQLHHQATANPALHSATAATVSTSAMRQVDRVSSDGTSSGLRRKGGSTPLVFGAPAHSTPSTARPDEFSSTTAVAADQDLEGEGRIHRSKTWFLLLLPKLALALIAGLVGCALCCVALHSVLRSTHLAVVGAGWARRMCGATRGTLSVEPLRFLYLYCCIYLYAMLDERFSCAWHRRSAV